MLMYINLTATERLNINRAAFVTAPYRKTDGAGAGSHEIRVYLWENLAVSRPVAEVLSFNTNGASVQE